MVVYHLIVNVNTEKYGKLCERYSYFSDVFVSLESAVKAGIEQVKKRIDEFFNEDSRYDKHELIEFIKEEIEYEFTVYELDPARKENQDILLRTDFENSTLENANEFSDVIEWHYNYRGELISRMECRGSGYEVFPSDYESEAAGTRFRVGDLVTQHETRLGESEDEIYVVTGVPGRRKDAKGPLYWENIYTINHLYKGEVYSAGCHDHVHESRLKPYLGNLPADSLLRVLSEIFKGERKVSEETNELLWSGEKIYTCDLKRHYQFIDELKPR
jgi:hypothetical protein